MIRKIHSILLLAFFAIQVNGQVGIGTVSPNSTLDIRGSFSAVYRSFTSATSLTANDHTVVFTGSSATTATLPDATTCVGRIYCIKNFSASAITPTLTISTVSAQKIDGLASWLLDEPNEVIIISSDGANWEVLSSGIPSSGSWNQGGNSVSGLRSLGTISAFDLPFITNNTEKMRIMSTGYVGIGSTAFSVNPEALLVYQNNATSFNVIAGKGNLNNYLQLNIQNLSSGTNASSDVVATADNGNEFTNYVDMGINSSGNTSAVMGSPDDAYLYTAGNNFLMGTANANKSLIFLTGGTTQSTNERMRIDGTGNVGIGTAPAYRLHVIAASNPLYLGGVQTGLGTDSILTIINGVVRKLSPSALATSSTNAWSLVGNNNTLASNYFLGTTNSDPLIIKVNSQPAGRIDLANTFLGPYAGNNNNNASTQNTAMGFHALFSNTNGTNNAALGYGALQNNTGSQNVGIGYNAETNSTNNSVAIGASTYVTGSDGIAIGNSAQAATNQYAVALGSNTYSSGSNAIAIGGAASGSKTQAQGTSSIALGFNVYSGGTNSIALGSGTNTSATNAVVIGNNATTGQANSIILGDATNAAVKVGIGTNTPAQKLDVNGNFNLSGAFMPGGSAGAVGDFLVSNGAAAPVWFNATPFLAGLAWMQGGNATGSVQKLGTTSNFDLPVITNNVERMRITNGGNVAVDPPTGVATFNATNPEKFLVDAGTTSSVNAIVGKGNNSTYLQLNIQNLNNGGNASSDVVSTADNGNETTNFVDMGMNSSGNTSGVMGAADDAYLYTTGNNFLIGTANAKALAFLTGGTTQSTNERMRIDATGNVGIGTNNPGNKLEVNSGAGGVSGLRLKQLPSGAVLFMSTTADVAQNNSNFYFDATNYRLSIAAGTSPASTLQVGGSMSVAITTKTANYTASGNDYTILCNNTGGAITISLPTAVGITGRIYVIKKISGLGNNVTVAGFGGSETIDGSTTNLITTQYNSIMIQSDGANWYILSKN